MQNYEFYNAEEYEVMFLPYLVQVQHYLGVLGPEYKRLISPFDWRSKVRLKEIERDDELIDMIFQEERFWHEHVENIPPALMVRVRPGILKTIYRS